MELKTARNIAIVALIAAAVFLLPGGGQAATTFATILYIGFGVGFGYLGLRMYREYRVTLHGLGDNYRGVLYGSLALVAFLIAGQKRMWESGLGELLWFALVLAVLYGLMSVYRYWRSY
ncbi:MAG TPA: hypothetical protein VGI52_08595 [Solirubrobacteraceae bacterium]|jgi:hypothetical protein